RGRTCGPRRGGGDHARRALGRRLHVLDGGDAGDRQRAHRRPRQPLDTRRGEFSVARPSRRGGAGQRGRARSQLPPTRGDRGAGAHPDPQLMKAARPVHGQLPRRWRRPAGRLAAVVALALLGLAGAAAAQRPRPAVADEVVMASQAPRLLSEFRFFRDAAAREPNARVTPYDLNTPLYSDGALKFRYVYIPPAAGPARYDGEEVFDFPVGTALIKTFAFAADMRAPSE